MTQRYRRRNQEEIMDFLVTDECYHILLQEVGLESMKVCVKDLSGLGSSHDPLIVSYAVTGGCLLIFLL